MPRTNEARQISRQRPQHGQRQRRDRDARRRSARRTASAAAGVNSQRHQAADDQAERLGPGDRAPGRRAAQVRPGHRRPEHLNAPYQAIRTTRELQRRSTQSQVCERNSDQPSRRSRSMLASLAPLVRGHPQGEHQRQRAEHARCRRWPAPSPARSAATQKPASTAPPIWAAVHRQPADRAGLLQQAGRAPSGAAAPGTPGRRWPCRCRSRHSSAIICHSARMAGQHQDAEGALAERRS